MTLSNLHLGVGEWIAIGLSAVLGIWFLAGIAANRKTARRIAAGLASALGGYRCGELGWVDLATAGIAIKPDSGRLPVERLEAVLSLERRENCPLWLFQHLAGKRDGIFLRARLGKKPDGELHLVPGREMALAASLSRAGGSTRLQEEYKAFKLFCDGETKDVMVSVVKSLADRFPESLLRVSVRREAPHLLLQFSPSILDGASKSRLSGMVEELIHAL
jgi:hypothetical protein